MTRDDINGEMLIIAMMQEINKVADERAFEYNVK